MDTITHTLFGLTTYGAVKKENMSQTTKKALFVAAVAGSQIPDIDFVVQISEQGRTMYQMWHRGLSHSIFLAPIWAALIYAICYFIWKEKDKIIFNVALLNVLIHIGSDSLNAWGTGLLEPVSSVRITLGVIPIVDVLIWIIMLVGFLFIKIKKMSPRYKVWRMVWCVILLHVAIQGAQGYLVYQEASANYEKVTLSAGFIPGHFTALGKNDSVVHMYQQRLFGEKELVETFHSHEEADLQPLFTENPRAEVLRQWAPFLVVVDNEEKLGVYDPRFYRNGESFLFEYIEK
ncbi:metal-dependent hydrolase [Priestia taiwanensis]|uniref:Inner membrane protein n=1 Tax=Priestia taiwanensis TaxID=1347902 RepID=A0A917APT5_9BACI|nr:metal-dependent hydrolase [Priestia taiwanensis]MBM7362722.1 inner membrane protein [Priestia taiwanensis]GGE64546.1 hypothetical protein GCM10007140_13450 [Priestia taiwanensis]